MEDVLRKFSILVISVIANLRMKTSKEVYSTEDILRSLPLQILAYFWIWSFSKIPEKTSREVFSDKHVSFAIDRSLSEIWLFIEDFPDKQVSFAIDRSLSKIWLFILLGDFYISLLKVFLKSFQCHTKSIVLLLQLIIFDFSREDFFPSQRFDQNPE